MHHDMTLTIDNESARSLWTSSYDVENVPFEIYFGHPGAISLTDFSRYKIDDTNGIKSSLKNFKYKADILYKSDGYNFIQTITKVDFDDPPLWQPNYFWVWFRKTH